MASLLDLANRLEAMADRLDQANSERAIAVAKTLLETLIYRTPVDTTAALSNWQVTLGSPASVFIPPYVPGNLGYTMMASARAALAAGIRVLETKKPGMTIYIANNAPYIGDLNRGTSKQAPAGFVEASVMIARKNIPDLKV